MGNFHIIPIYILFVEICSRGGFMKIQRDLRTETAMEKSRARDPLQRLSADPSRHKKEIHKSRYKTDPCQSYSDRGFFS